MAESSRNGNYEALAELFFTGVCTVPDGMGELIPCAQEAAAIRRCGFDARPGRLFRCPALPDELVGGSPLLGHLSDIDPASRFAPWHPKRAAPLGTAHLDPLSKTDKLFLAALERAPDRRLRKCDFQRKLWRHFPAEFFHRTLDRLVAEDRITIDDDWTYRLSRAEFEAKQQEARERERRPHLSTIP